MVAQHYRWDFIGLSTDVKPTPETSEKVVDGSTYYCSDNSKLYVYCKDNWYERKALGGGGGGTTDFDELDNRPKYNGTTMSSTTNIPEVKSYTAGTNVSISDSNVISATDTTYTAGTNVSISDGNVISATDTTYSNFTGTDGTAAGAAGLVPAPATTDAGKFLKADGTWATAGGGGGVIELTSSDFDVPVANPQGVALWNLRVGIYKNATGDNMYMYYNGSSATTSHRKMLRAGDYFTVLFRREYNNQTAVVVQTGADSYNDPEFIYSTSNTGTINDMVSFQKVANNLTTSSNGTRVLDAYQGKVLSDRNQIESTAPTSSTYGVLGGLYTDTTNMHTYQCTAISGDTYTWTQRW